MSKTIIVSNRLPVKIKRVNDALEYTSSEGGLATGLGSIYKQGNNIWLGWPGMSFSEDQEEEVRAGLKKENMRPVFLSEQDHRKYYLGFSNQTLWPAFHYFMQFVDYDDENWQTYKDANAKFAEAIVREYEDGDIVWVHDYQLLLVPGMVRKSKPNATIGFFQHIPFPSYEVFRTLPWRKELLNGMLGADYLAFHTYDDLRHFLSSVHRLAGYGYVGNNIQLRDRMVRADALPMGIDYDKYAQNATHPETIRRIQRYAKGFTARKLVLSIDRLDYSKGIVRRLKVMDRFFTKHPEYKEKVSLLLLVVPSRDRVPDYQKLKEQVDELVGRINGKYGRIGWTPIHYFYRSFPLRALGAFYRMSDVAMVTPVRDGMNLVCKEFIASRTDGDGVLILSEMAGASKELSDAILVNPNDLDSLVEALKTALEMPMEEQRQHMGVMQQTIKKYDIYNWVSLFFENLKFVKKLQAERATLELKGENQEKLLDAYTKSKKRLILLDYDGTLVGFNTDPMACAPDEYLKKMLKDIGSQPGNHLVIISGRKVDTLGEWLRDIPASLIAEHGLWRKMAGSDWEKPSTQTKDGWYEIAETILNSYVDRTPGSFIERKRNSLVWHYRKVDAGLGEIRKSELASHLKHVMEEYSVEIMSGNNVLELKPSSSNKGIAAGEMMARLNPDFALCIGDDVTDESMFEALNKKAYTVKVGAGQSSADYYLENVDGVRSFLNRLREQST